MSKDLSELRREYDKHQLVESKLPESPHVLFSNWFNDLLKTAPKEANAVILATAGRDSHPSARVVLIKSFDEDGFVFFTNYKSKKGRQLKENKNASLLFYWPDLERQVRIEGSVEKVSESQSEEYFNSRPKGSRIGAIISDQSSKVSGREELEQKYNAFSGEIKRPETWGGYVLLPSYYEFWQGRENRLHDRISYEVKTDGGWKHFRLAP